MSEEETRLLGPGNEHLKNPTARNATLIGAIIFTILGCTCLLATTDLHSKYPLSGDPLFEHRQYGDPCNVNAIATEEGSCNTDFYLTCDRNTSTCRCKAGMYVDVKSSTGRCLAKVGERCTNYEEKGLPIKYCTPDAECLPDISGALRCNCKGHFLPNSYGACSATYAGPCNTNVDCRSRSFLKCGPGQTCICDFENGSQVWSSILQQCVSLIGANCTPEGAVERPCIDAKKSFCQKDVSGSICKCNPGFTPSARNHRCAIPYNGACDTTADCAHHLVCNPEKHCGCQNPKDEFYDFVHEQCVVYAGASCMDPEENLMACVEGATCALVLPERTNIMCSCNENFHEENRFCVLNSGISVQSIRFLLFSVVVFNIVKLLFPEFNVFVETSFGLD